MEATGGDVRPEEESSDEDMLSDSPGWEPEDDYDDENKVWERPPPEEMGQHLLAALSRIHQLRTELWCGYHGSPLREAVDRVSSHREQPAAVHLDMGRPPVEALCDMAPGLFRHSLRSWSCGACGASGSTRIYYHQDGDDQGGPPVAGCEGCGHRVVHLSSKTVPGMCLLVDSPERGRGDTLVLQDGSYRMAAFVSAKRGLVSSSHGLFEVCASMVGKGVRSKDGILGVYVAPSFPPLSKLPGVLHVHIQVKPRPVSFPGKMVPLFEMMNFKGNRWLFYHVKPWDSCCRTATMTIFEIFPALMNGYFQNKALVFHPELRRLLDELKVFWLATSPGKNPGTAMATCLWRGFLNSLPRSLNCDSCNTFVWLTRYQSMCQECGFLRFPPFRYYQVCPASCTTDFGMPLEAVRWLERSFVWDMAVHLDADMSQRETMHPDGTEVDAGGFKVAKTGSTLWLRGPGRFCMGTPAEARSAVEEACEALGIGPVRAHPQDHAFGVTHWLASEGECCKGFRRLAMPVICSPGNERDQDGLLGDPIIDLARTFV